MKRYSFFALWMIPMALIVSPFSGHAQKKEKEDKPSTPHPVLTQVRDNVYMLRDYDGNTGILVSNDGLLLVDAKSGRNALRAKSVIDSAFGKPVKIVINTHHHADHTGGDSVMAAGAQLIMHANCKSILTARLTSAGRDHTYVDNAKTFRENLTIDFGGEKVSMNYYGSAHTSNDIIVVFEKAKVVCTGDILFNRCPPYVDVDDHANTANWIRILRMLSSEYNDYLFIPGHGGIGNMIDLSKFAGCLQYLRDQVGQSIADGKTLEETLASVNLDRFPNIVDLRPDGLTLRQTVGQIYREMSAAK